MNKKNNPKTFLGQLRSSFFAGLIFIIPLSITISLTSWVSHYIYSTFKVLAPTQFQGGIKTIVFMLICLILVISIITIMGYMMKFYLIRWVLSLGEKILKVVPLMSKVYDFTKQAVSAIFVDKSMNRLPVLINLEIGGKQVNTLAFVTNTLKVKGCIKYLVFIPTAPNPASGFCLFIDKEDIEDVDINFDEAFQLLVSLGTLTPKRWDLSKEEQEKYNIQAR